MNFVFDAEHVTVINAGMIILLQVFVSRIVKNRPALPTMVTGMLIGGARVRCCLALSQNAWVFVLGIAVFSIGEMTAHPKYYSFVGLVAPADRKAVYMGYAFLYGVFGSLLGSNLGAFLYERMLKPVVGSREPPRTIRLFWLIFVAIDVVAAAAGSSVLREGSGQDTPATRRRARVLMYVVYVADHAARRVLPVLPLRLADRLQVGGPGADLPRPRCGRSVDEPPLIGAAVRRRVLRPGLQRSASRPPGRKTRPISSTRAVSRRRGRRDGAPCARYSLPATTCYLLPATCYRYFISIAFCSSSARNSGAAMSISALARCLSVFPYKSATPCSVTT